MWWVARGLRKRVSNSSTMATWTARAHRRNEPNASKPSMTTQLYLFHSPLVPVTYLHWKEAFFILCLCAVQHSRLLASDWIITICDNYERIYFCWYNCAFCHINLLVENHKLSGAETEAYRSCCLTLHTTEGWLKHRINNNYTIIIDQLVVSLYLQKCQHEKK